jgi:hypothetical protein
MILPIDAMGYGSSLPQTHAPQSMFPVTKQGARQGFVLALRNEAGRLCRLGAKNCKAFQLLAKALQLLAKVWDFPFNSLRFLVSESSPINDLR